MNKKYYLDEEWRTIIGYEGLYEVSSYGRIRSSNYRNSNKTTILQTTAKKGNYIKVGLRKDGKIRYYRVHRLVAIAFLPPPRPWETQVGHINGDNQDNFYINLEWCTPKGNMANLITRIRMSMGHQNPSAETRRRMSEGQLRRFRRERATRTGRYAVI